MSTDTLSNSRPTTLSNTRPNIILIMADDMGFSDIGCYGSEIQTPNLDRLAHNGLRFSQMYNNARCCPTRASLLTGLYPHQAGIGHMMENRGTRAYQGYLRDDCVTIAEVLRERGYRTMMSGKWHVGGSYNPLNPAIWNPGTPDHPTPRQRGFERYYGTLDGAGSFFHPHSVMDDDTMILYGDEHFGDEYYYTDAISENAAKMIDEVAASNRAKDTGQDSAQDAGQAPFFLYVGYTAPHWPLHALPEDIAKYEGMYRAGWDTLRTNRHEELNGSGVLDSRWSISPRDETAPAWDDANYHDWEDLRMAVYAAQIDRMDQGIGQIIAKLEEHGMLENTLIMFLSDNGGCAELLSEDGGIQRYALQTPDGTLMRVGNAPDVRPGPAFTFMSYDLPWANASNSPFRLYKHWTHEGGIATPFVAHWPAGIGAQSEHHTGIVHSPCHIIDIMATCVDIAGATYPTEYNGNSIQALEGESMAPAFTNLDQGQVWTRDQRIFWEHEGNRCVRDGEWKLVSRHPGEWELYNMTEDRTELTDLAMTENERVKVLTAAYDAWADRCEVRPWPLR
ncbi:MAG: arylsulfatase [Chloroflexota bacterium]